MRLHPHRALYVLLLRLLSVAFLSVEKSIFNKGISSAVFSCFRREGRRKSGSSGSGLKCEMVPPFPVFCVFLRAGTPIDVIVLPRVFSLNARLLLAKVENEVLYVCVCVCVSARACDAATIFRVLRDTIPHSRSSLNAAQCEMRP